MNTACQTDVRIGAGWKAALESAAVEVVELMAGVRLRTWTAPYAEQRGDAVAMVGLGGALCGMATVRCSTETARNLGERMLGGETGVSESTIDDALGEICNMIAGNFKSKVPGLADRCMLSVPTVIRGDDFSLRGIAADNSIRVVLELEGQPMGITLLIRS